MVAKSATSHESACRLPHALATASS